MANYYPSYAWNSLYGIIQQWEAFGVFTVLLPLVLVFTIVFAILEKINLFHNRGVNLLIALVIGFFTVSNPYVGAFFMNFFANIGIGIAIIIGLVVLLGVSLKPDTDSWRWIFSIFGGVIFLVVLARSGVFETVVGNNFWYWFQANSAIVIIFIFVGLMVAAVLIGSIAAQKKSNIQIPMGR